jgi:hypothetical protein
MQNSSLETKRPRSARRLFVTLLLVCVLLLGAGAVAFVWLAIPPRHLVSGAVRIAPTVTDILDSEPKPYDREAYAVRMNTEAVRLRSNPSILLKIVEDLADRGSTFFSSAKSRPTQEGEPPGPAGILRQAIIDGVISIRPVENTELLEVSMVSRDEEEAKTIVNSFLNNYAAQHAVERTSADMQMITQLERHCEELRAKVLAGRDRIHTMAEEWGTTDLDPLREMELQRQELLLDELKQIEIRRMRMEAGMARIAEEGAMAPESRMMLAARTEHVNSDPLVQALSHRVADIQVDLAMARVGEPNDTSAIRAQEAVLEALGRQIETRRQKLLQEFDAALPDRLKEAERQRQADDKAALQQLEAYQDQITRTLVAQEVKTARVGAADLGIRDQEFGVQLDQEALEKVTRRLHELEMHGDLSPRVHVAIPAEVRELVDHRVRWTLVSVGATLVLSTILLIVRRVL